MQPPVGFWDPLGLSVTGSLAEIVKEWKKRFDADHFFEMERNELTRSSRSPPLLSPIETSTAKLLPHYVYYVLLLSGTL